MQTRHSTYVLLHDDDLLLAMDAVRREMRDPTPRTTSLWDFSGTRSAMQLVTALAMMQQELDIRMAEKASRTP